MSRYGVARGRMVVQQLANINCDRVLKVMATLPRHEFVPEILRHRAYEDGPLPIDKRQTISQPWIVARMTELLQLSETDLVLEIGTGSGYQTAVLSHLCKKVVSIERHSDLAKKARALLEGSGLRNVTVLSGDGTLGRSEFAPYDAILVTAGAPSIPRPLKSQLRVGGRLVVPVGDEQAQELVLVRRESETEYSEQRFGGCRFVPLLGRFGWKD